MIEIDAGLPYTLTVFGAKSLKEAKKKITAWPYFVKHGKLRSDTPRKFGESTKTTIAIGL